MTNAAFRRLLARAERLERLEADVRWKYGIHWKARESLRYHGKAGALVARLVDKASGIRDALHDADREHQRELTAKAISMAAAIRKQLAREPATKRPGIRAGVRRGVLERDGFRCVDCGRGAPEVVLHVDHRRSRKDGGTDDLSNLATTCRDCNLGKGSRSIPWPGRPADCAEVHP